MDRTRKLAEQLQNTEIKVLRKLRKNKSLYVDALASATKLKQVEVGRSAMYLENKRLIKQTKTKTKFIELDCLGKQYAKSELPEFKFLKLVSKSPKTLEQLKKSLGADEVKFSLGHWKKKGLVLFDKGKVKSVPIKKPTTSSGSKLIKKLAKTPLELDKLSESELKAYKELGRRKAIIKTSEKTTVDLEITARGEKVAKEIQSLPKNRIEHLTQSLIKSKEWKTSSFRRYDVEAKVPIIAAGKKQAYLAFLDDVKKTLVSMGFTEMTGPLVEATFFNNDALFMPQDHPARGIHGDYTVKGKADLKRYTEAIKAVKKVHKEGGYGSRGWGGEFSEDITKQLVLRSQTTALSARMLLNKNLKIPGKYFAVGRNYRPDTVDSTHLTEFNQMEGIVLGEDVSFRQLLSLLSELAKRLAGVKKIKFVQGYFPFTEPSVEGFVQLKDGRWTEIFAAGVLRPEVTKPLGIDVPVLAWGPGIDRLFMVKEGLNDIRHLFSSDLKWLRGAKI